MTPCHIRRDAIDAPEGRPEHARTRADRRPHCGAPYPARDKWHGWGFEYRSDLAIGSWPLLHIAFKYRPNRTPVVARGVIAIGQFACGGLCISQFGIGLVSVSQFTVAGFALAQFAAA